MANREILVVSFGTTVKTAREKALDSILVSMRDAFPDVTVERCFTSKMVRDKIAREEGITMAGPQEALQQAVDNGIDELIVIPTHLMEGIDLRDFKSVLAEYKDRFKICKCAGPLAETMEDRQLCVKAISERLSEAMDLKASDESTAVVLIGHGTKDKANSLYENLQTEMNEWGYERFVIGTIEATPSYDDVVEGLKKLEVSNVILVPFLVVAGDHAVNDIAGDQEDSWKNRLSQEGFSVKVLKEGLGEMRGIHSLLISHAERLVNA